MKSWLRFDPAQPAGGRDPANKTAVTYGYWGSAGTVSHAQLSLIGWGETGNGMKALGAWGKSLTIDPTQHIGSAFLDDIRPTFTQSYKNNGQYKDEGIVNTTYNWTENVNVGTSSLF